SGATALAGGMSVADSFVPALSVASSCDLVVLPSASPAFASASFIAGAGSGGAGAAARAPFRKRFHPEWLSAAETLLDSVLAGAEAVCDCQLIVRYAGAVMPEGVGILLSLRYSAGREKDPPESSRPKRCHCAESGTITSSISRRVTLVSPLSL